MRCFYWFSDKAAHYPLARYVQINLYSKDGFDALPRKKCTEGIVKKGLRLYNFTLQSL
jgi:hypothetical protein